MRARNPVSLTQRPVDDRRFSRADVVASTTTSVVSALPVFLIAALAPQIRAALDFDVAAFGFAVALYYLSASLGSVPLSWLVEAISATRAMRWGNALTGMLLLLAAWGIDNWLTLSLFMVAAGLASAALQPATNLFLIRRVPAARRGLAFGAKQAAVPLAVVVSGLAVPTLALTFGWRWTLAVVAGLALAASYMVPPAPSSLAAYRARAPIPPLAGRDVGDLAVLTAGFALSVAAASALSAFAVTALDAMGKSQASAGLLVSLGGMIAAATRVTVGAQADRRVRRPLLLVVAMLGVGALAYGALALATACWITLLLPAMLLAFAAGWGWNGLFSLAIATRYPEQAARATAVTSIGGRAGGVLGPFVFGLVVTQASYAWAWLIAAASTCVGGLIILLAQHLTERRRTGTTP